MGRATRIDPVAPVAPVLPRPITSAPFRVPAYMSRDLPSPPEMRPAAVRVPAATESQPATPEPSAGVPATAAPSAAEAPAEPLADAGETEGEEEASAEAGEGEPTPPEETPGEATPGEAAPGEAAPGEAAPGEAAPGEATAGGTEPVAAAPAGAERRRSRLTAIRAGGGEAVAEAAVEPTRGTVSLPRAPMLVPPISATFDASGALDLRPERPPDPRREPPSREWLTHREVFSEAIAAARRLYDSLLADGARFAAAARAAEDSNASRRQADLDADLTRLTQGLDEARAMVRQTAADSLRMLRRRAGGARARINRAAGDALGALTRAENTLTIQLIVPRATRAGILAAASSAQASVTANGAAAATALETLGSNADTEFPDSGGPLASAKNEAIAVRLPARVARRAAFFDQERGAQEALLSASFGTLGADFDRAFAEVDQLAENVSTKGRTAVQTARGAATRQLDSAVRRMGRAIEQGAASADAALVQQHENSRNRLIEGATERGRSETRAAARRAASEGEAVAALAGAQGKAISAVTVALAPNRTRPAAHFARAVIGAATGMRARLGDIDTVHRTRLARTAADGRAGQERQSRATAAAVAASAAGMARNLNESARQRAEQMRAETDQGSATFPAMAEPVSASIASYMPPVGQAYLDVFTRLSDAITATSTRVGNVLTGTRGEGPPDAAPAPAPPAPSPPPTMAPNAFITLGEGVAADAKTDERVADLITRSNAEVPRVIESKSTAAHDALGVVLSSNVDALMAALRAITRRQGAAIKADYNRFGIGLEAQIRRDLPSGTSLHETNMRNVNAAINYLNGNAVAGALEEMKAAVIWWNNEARVEAAQRNLTPAQMGELQDLHAEDLADIGGDLDEADASVFNALSGVDETSTGAERSAAVGRADAVRLRSGITSDRDTRGDPGADLVVDRLLRSASSSGADPIAGGDPLGLEEPEVREARRAETWLATQRAFGRLEGASAGEIASDPAAALIRFATAERDYDVFVPDDYPRTHDDMGPGGHWETRREGVSRDQARLIGMAVRENPGSTRTAGAILAVENTRAGRPRMDRLDMALHDPSLDAREGESAAEREAARPERERRALERRNEIWGLADQYVREGEPGPVRTPDQMRDYMADRMRTRFAGDASAIEYATSMVRNLEANPQAGFRYAMDHPAEREETFKRITGRMDRSQIETEVARWDANRGSGRPTLYDELGLFQQESTFDTWWNAKLSGDARNAVEISFMGVPRNDLERAEVARHVMQQQVRDAGVLGPLFAYGDYSRMVQNLARLEREMGVKPGDIDRFGRVRRINPITGQPIVLGRFNERGEFVPGERGSREAFESSIHLARLTAESYKLTTDRAATAVVTGLVVIAAVVTTALTGGAAASIWIPVLVTAGAGLAGMAMSMAIRGDRYTRSEFERDFVMTIVQAATAGAGAAVGTAMRGGMPALRAAASRMAVADDVVMGFAQAAGRRGALTLTQEALIAGGSNAINSAAGAAMDPHNRMLGKSGEEALTAGIRGFFGGAAGSALMRPIMRAGVREPGVAGTASRFDRAALRVLGAGDSTTRRALGSAFSSAGTRAAEIGVDRARGRRGVTSEATAGEIRDMFLQGLLQGALERRGEVFGDRMRARRVAARTAPAASELPAPVREPPPPPPPRDAPVALPPQVAHAVPPGLHGTVGDAARAARHAAPAAEPTPVPVRPTVTLAEPTLPRPMPATAEAPAVPRAVSGDDEPTLRFVRPPADEAVDPTRQPPRPSEEAEPPTLRQPAPGEEAEPPTRRRPPPLPEDARQASARRRAEAAEPELIELPETSAMMPPDPRSRAQAEEMFQNSIRDDPSREVGLYVNSVTGEHVLIQGTERMVIVAGDERNPVGIAGEGHPQRWKELLDADRGEWHLVAHNHPGNADDSPDGWRTRLPSGRGGDFSVMMDESRAMGGATRHSRIAVMHEGRPSITEFAYDPSSPRPFAIIYDDPATGQRVFRRFKSLEGYGEFFASRTGGSPDIDTPSAPAAAPRPDEIPPPRGTRAADTDAAAERLAQARELADLDAAITRQREAVVALGVGHPDYPAALAALPELSARADALLVRMGMVPESGRVDAPDAPARRRGLADDPAAGRALQEAVDRQIGDALSRRRAITAPPDVTPLPPEARIARGARDVDRAEIAARARARRLDDRLERVEAEGDRSLPREAYEEARRARRIAAREARLDDLAFDLMAAAAGTPEPAPRQLGPAPDPARIAQAEIDRLIAAMRANRNDADAERLQALVDRGGEPMRRLLLAETEQGMARQRAALRDHLRTSMTEAEVTRALADLDDLYFNRAAQYGFGTERRRTMRAAEEDAIDERLARRGIADDVPEAAALRAILADRAGESSFIARRLHASTDLGGGESDLVQQWRAYHARLAAGTPPTAEGFDAYLRAYMSSTQRPRFSELSAAHLLAEIPDVPPAVRRQAAAMGLELLKTALEVDPRTGASRNAPWEPGSDILGYRRSDDHIVYADDKAWRRTERNRGLIDEVSALTSSLPGNMETDAAALRAQLARLAALGLPVDPAHAAVPARLEACAAALRAAFPDGITLTDPNPQRLRDILARHRVELVVTSAADRGIVDVAPRLRRAGFRFLIFIPREREED